MFKHYDNIIDTATGEAIPGVKVYVYDMETHTIVPLFEDAAGDEPKLNPVVSNSNGYYDFCVADGLYQIEYEIGGDVVQIIPDVTIVDAAKALADTDIRITNAVNRLVTVEQSIAALRPSNAVKRYLIGTFAPSNILANEILIDHESVTEWTLAINFAGYQVSVGTPPDADYVLTVLRNDVQIGTITIHDTGLSTAQLLFNVTVAAGDLITVRAPATPDASIARLRITLVGVVTPEEEE